MERKTTNGRTIGKMSLAVSAEMRAELARKGYTVQAFSRISKLPLSTLHKTLKGQRVVDVEDLISICFHLEIEPGEILSRAEKAITKTSANNVTQTAANLTLADMLDHSTEEAFFDETKMAALNETPRVDKEDWAE